MEAFLPVLKEFGFPIGLCLLLLWAIRSQNAQLVKSYTDRISTLEHIVRDLTNKVEELEQDRIRRADEYGHTLKDIALRWSAATRETNAVIKDTLMVMRRLCDSIKVRPCMMDAYKPHDTPRPPSGAEIPKDPAQVDTETIGGRA